MISSLATAYLFLGGAGGGGVLALSILECMRCWPRMGSLAREIHPDSYARSWVISLFCLVLGSFFLLIDLGRADYAWLLFVSFAPSPLVVGACAIALSCLVAAMFSCYECIDGMRWPLFVLRVCSIVGVCAGFVTIVYTGVLLSSMPSVVAWQTPLVPVLFVLSSCSCGIVIVLGSFLLSNDRILSWRVQKALVRVDSVLIVAELVAAAAFVARLFGNDQCTQAAMQLMSGCLSLCFWGGFVVLGLFAPLLLEQMEITRRKLYLLVWIVGFVLVGALFLRFWMVTLGAFDASAMYGARAVYLAVQ